MTPRARLRVRVVRGVRRKTTESSPIVGIGFEMVMAAALAQYKNPTWTSTTIQRGFSGNG